MTWFAYPFVVQVTYQTKLFDRDENGGWVYKHKKYVRLIVMLSFIIEDIS